MQKVSRIPSYAVGDLQFRQSTGCKDSYANIAKPDYSKPRTFVHYSSVSHPLKLCKAASTIVANLEIQIMGHSY